jgi:hypothetical protein
MTKLRQYSPLDIILDRHGARDFAQIPRRFLAQGDSWFTFGAVNVLSTGNLLNDMELAVESCAVNCATPGKVLSHMVDLRSQVHFRNLLIGAQRWDWHAILLSGGGNDLIDFIGVPPRTADGVAVPKKLRALLTAAERGTATKAADYLSDDGWQTFVAHLVPQFHAVVALRDHKKSNSQGVPIISHTYDIITPCNVGPGLGLPAWLYPALTAYQVPEDVWVELAGLFLGKYRTLVESLARDLPNFHVAQTQGVLQPPPLGATGPTPDWQNEIHPSPEGYRQLGRIYAAKIDAVLAAA